MTTYAPVERLTGDHDASSFDCGSDAQTNWLRRYALIAERADTARVYVIRPHAEQRIAAFYALAAGSVEVDDATGRLSVGTGRHPLPVVVLTRLGVDLRDQHQGLGSELVNDAFLQTAAVADIVGARALLIHAETPSAAAFYRRLDPAFEELPGNPLHIVLLMKDLRAALAKAGQSLRRLAERTHTNPGTIARSLLSRALDEADPDPRNIPDLLDRIPGAWEDVQAGLAEADAGLGKPLEDL